MSFQRISVYRCKSGLLPGHNYETVVKVTWEILHEIARKTKRRPYVRSAYFKNEKIFLDNFWPHIKQKTPKERYRRLRLLNCALELIKKSKVEPVHRLQLSDENLYRFVGKTGNLLFAVQIKEDLKRKQKFFMSVFPI